MVLRRIKDRLQFNVAVAELEHQDLWQRASLGVVAISNTTIHVEQELAAAADEIASRAGTHLTVGGRISHVMAQGHRPDRVGDQIRQELSDLLSRGASTILDRFHHPHPVKMSPVQLARVFYTMMVTPPRRETAAALERHAVPAAAGGQLAAPAARA